MLKKDKRAQVFQIAMLLIAIFVVGFTIVLGKTLLTSFYSAMGDSGLNTVEMTQAQTQMETAYGAFDYGMIVLTVGLIIGLIISSFMIPTSRIFLVVNVIGIFVLILIGIVLTNSYGELVSGEGASTGLGDAADNFTNINFLLSYLPYIGAILVFILSVITYSRSGEPT